MLEMLETVVFSARMELVFSIIIEAMDVRWGQVKVQRRLGTVLANLSVTCTDRQLADHSLGSSLLCP
jgi:hypothetical protein